MSVYLVPPDPKEEQESAPLEMWFAQVFEHELEGWHTDESPWPQRRDLATFLEWFDIETNSVVVDLASGPIELVSRDRTLNSTFCTTKQKEYDFSKAKKNPYASRLKRQVTIRLDTATIAYFKELSEETGIPYQTLINPYLKECATTQKKISLKWRRAS